MTVIALFFVSNKKVHAVIVIFLLLILTIAFTPDQYIDRFESSFTGREVEGHSASKRIELFKDSIKVFADHPLGVGMGCFKVVQGREGRNAQDTHNLYTQILSEIGLFGFFAFYYFISSIIRSLLLTKKRVMRLVEKITQLPESGIDVSDCGEDCFNLRLIDCICSAILLMLFVRIVLGCFGHDLYEMYWWIAAGLALSVSRIVIYFEDKYRHIFLLGNSI
jgi:O-antigen ligase